MKKTRYYIYVLGILGIFVVLMSFLLISRTRAAPDSVTMSIYKGWNIISSPFEEPLDLTEIAKSCKLTTYQGKIWAWAYDPANGWTQPTQVSKGEGVYVLSKENCTINSTGDLAVFSPRTLKGGWNLISAEKSFEEIRGDCEMAPNTGIWEFDSKSGQWNIVSVQDDLKRGKGYWVAVKNNCQLQLVASRRPLLTLFLLKDTRVCNIPGMECLNLKLDERETTQIKTEAAKFVSEIYQWTGGAINPELLAVEIATSSNVEMTQWGMGWYLAPWNVKSLISPFLTEKIDFILLTHDLYDDSQKLVIPSPVCGGTLGADWGVGGTSYVWVPKTNPGYWFECSHAGNYMHEWLNAMDGTLEKISHVEDIYKGTYPPCGGGDPNGYKWFPLASRDNEVDPDYKACGNPKYCDSMGWDNQRCNLEWHKHILKKHYNPLTDLIGNYCRNGAKDFGETGTDCGVACGTTCPSLSP